jgi:hypothetical protein
MTNSFNDHPQRDLLEILLTQNLNEIQLTASTMPTQISGLIFDSLRTQKMHSYYDILNYFRLLLLLDKLGDYEHTSDWDPYLTFHFKDGTTFTTCQGYWIPEEIGTQSILIEGPTPDNADIADLDPRYYSRTEELYYLPTMQIDSITLHR